MVSISKGKEDERDPPLQDMPANTTTQSIVIPDTSESQPGRPEDNMSNASKYTAVIVLFIVNLLNYMDRSTVAGKSIYTCYVIVMSLRVYSDPIAENHLPQRKVQQDLINSALCN